MSVDWNSRNEHPIKPRKRTLLTASILVIAVLAVAAAIVAFTQTSPSTTIPSGPALSPLCATLANFTKPAPTTGSVAYSCTGQVAAFTASNGPVTATPMIHGLPSSVTLTFYSGAQNLSPCPGSDPSATILNNTSMNIASGNYNYCVFYTALASGLTFTFSITWS